MPHGRSAPIAIVGIGCRLPGAHGPDEFWRRLCDGYDAIGPIPPDRVGLSALSDPESFLRRRNFAPSGGFLTGLDRFEPTFFGIPPRAAGRMDPQQRLLLETGWEALEDAGLPPDQLAGSRTGVFIGHLGADYWDLQCRTTTVDLHAGTAGQRSMLAGCLSYTLDLRGPSVAVDSGCSASLVATRQACLSLAGGESSVALVGGTSVLLLPENYLPLSQAGLLAKDGRCKFGDVDADGFVRSEGVAVVVLKTLERARADGDRVYALITGGAVNNDGRAAGYVGRPAVEGQVDVLRAAYADAGVNPSDVDYVEAHGTGTRVGDPIEFEALGAVLGEGRPSDQPCLVGSVKTNIGHTEGAAGIASMMKTALCLYHGMVPPSLHLRTPNPAVPWSALPVSVVTENTPIPARGRPRVAGVSAFSVTGTNAHVVLTEAEVAPRAPRTESATGDTAYLFTTSARTAEGLADAARGYADYLETGLGQRYSLRDVCYTATRRAQHVERLAVVGSSHEDIAAKLRGYADGIRAGDVASASDVGGRPRVVFVFPGHGTQWVGMGRALLEQEPVFRSAVEECDRAVHKETGWSILDALDDSDRLGVVEVVQPALWAVEIGLAALWRSWGVEPDLVIGHSMGEAAAAYVAGALSLSDAATVICRRSVLAARLSGRGAMASVALAPEQAAEVVAAYVDRVSIAASNSPASSVLSGDPDAVAEILATLRERDVFCRRIDVDYAAHSPQVDGLREELLAGLAELKPRQGELQLHSTVLDETVDGSTLDAEYWVRNLREPVRFASAVRTLLGRGPTVFLEISPHPVLVPSIEECIEVHQGDGAAVPSLRRDQADSAALLRRLGTLYLHGVPVRGDQLFGCAARLVSPPVYRWQRESYWITPEQPFRTLVAREGNQRNGHPLLGPCVSAGQGERVWEGPLDRIRNAYLDDHRVQGMAVLPGSAFCELVVAASRQLFGDVPVALADLTLRKVLVLAAEETRRLRVRMAEQDDAVWHVEIASSTETGADATWTRHAEARVLSGGQADDEPPTGDLPEVIRGRCAERLSGKDFYRRLAAGGNDWLPRFQGIAELWRGDGEALARVVCPDSLTSQLADFHFHPALFDACGQALTALTDRPGQTFVLSAIGEGRVYRGSGRELWSHVSVSHGDDPHSIVGDIRILDTTGKLVAELRGVQGRYLAGPGAAPSEDDRLYELCWDQDDRRRAPVAPGAWVLVPDTGGAAEQLRGRLEQAGHACVMLAIDPGDPDSTRRSLARALDTGGVPVRGIVHMGFLDLTTSDADPQDADSVESACLTVVRLVQALTAQRADSLSRLWLVTQGAQAVSPNESSTATLQTPLWGLGRTLAGEHPELSPTLIDVDTDARFPADALCRELTTADEENQVALRGGTRYLARLRRYSSPRPTGERTRPRRRGAFRVGMAKRGVLDAFRIEDATRRQPGPGEVEVETAYMGLNYADVLGVLDMYPGAADLEVRPGAEFSGTVTAVGDLVHGLRVGDEVLGFGPGGLESHVIAKAALVFRRPAALGHQDAATLPAVFLTAYHALCHLANIGRGDRVLIHTATGGVGLAAIQIARWKEATVFATAGSPEKRALLRTMGIRHVADSRSSAFADEFLAATHGKGVDVVLNTLAGPAIQRNLELLAPYGRYLELTKKDVLGDGSIALRALGRNISFHVVDVADMVRNAPERVSAVMAEVLAHVQSGTLAGLPSRTHPAHRATDAFRSLAKAEHIGKVLVSFAGDTADTADTADIEYADDTVDVSRPDALVRPDASYLVTGGLGGLGSKVAEWLVARGARHLCLVGRSSVAHDNPVVAALERAGAKVHYQAADVTDEAAMRAVLADVAERGWPSVRGVVHAAGVGAYHAIDDLDAAVLADVLRPKVRGSLVLDRLFRDAGLDFLVLFSSAASVLDSPMLGAYATANAFLDGLARQRRRRGEAALSINWGAWDSVGMATRAMTVSHRPLPAGMRGLRSEDGLAAMERLLRHEATQVAVFAIDWPAWAEAHPQAAQSPLLAELVSRRVSGPPVETRVTRPPVARSGKDRRETISRYLVEQLAAGLGIPAERIRTRESLNRLGLDSLTAVELKNRVSQDLGVTLPVVSLLSGYTLAELIDQLAAAEPDSVLPERAE
nr:type I polyketide synthase [Kibdelosporangium sp. MJ126-NF4]CEL12898.1 Malonyl CoA-acyl carrier protein transacylase [Kibdelosporangium sp. MJ126-NF4]CTQ98582.1 Malonyl CoA-acyl carrier protein transacylase (EC 2.3.1.39) [Kibdelosporangium sp. MJ126-NF4]